MKFFALIFLPLLIHATKGKGGGGDGAIPNEATTQTANYTITHTYTYSASYSSFITFPTCTLSRVITVETTSTEIVVQATSDGQAEDLVKDIVKTRGFPIPTPRVIATAGIYPLGLEISIYRSDSTCTAIVTGSSRGGGSGAAPRAVIMSEKWAWIIPGISILLGGLMVAL